MALVQRRESPNPNPILEDLWRTTGLDRAPEPARLNATLGYHEGVSLSATLHAERAPEPPPAPSPAPAPDAPPKHRITLALPRAAGGGATAGGADSEVDVTGVLGEGGMGRVLLAHQRSLDRDVAVKVLKGGAGDGAPDATLVVTLLDEGHAMARVEHPNVVPVYALGRDERGLPALVMKRIEGTSWLDLILDPQHAAWETVQTVAHDRLLAHLEILMAVCNAVHFAHARGVIHRDIKPENVIVGRYGEVYLADWGIALRLAEVGAGGRAAQPRLVGTPVYMAPEMVSGDPRKVDARTDVYLLGATLHEVLTGDPRHPGDTLPAVLVAALESHPATYPPAVPAELGAICNRATRPDPAERYDSALAFRAALAGYLQHRGSIALSDAARALLAKLRDELARAGDGGAVTEWDLAAIYRLASECRFGFGQALREWPENAAAREGLRACLEELAGFEIARGAADAARALLAEVPGGAAPELRARLDALEARVRAERERSAELERRARELDLEAASGVYARFLAPVGGALAVVLVTTVSLRSSGRSSPVLTEVIGAAVLCVGMLVSVLLNRQRLLDREASRRVVGVFAAMFVGVLAHRLVAWLAGMSEHALFAGDAVVVAGIAAVGGIVLYRWIWGIAATFAGVSALCALIPRAAGALFGVAALVCVVGAVRAWRATERRTASDAAAAAAAAAATAKTTSTTTRT